MRRLLMRCALPFLLVTIKVLLPGEAMADLYTYTSFNDPNAVYGTFASGINDSGQIAGRFTDASGLNQGFLYSSQGFSPINVPGAYQTIANGINAAGAITGYYNSSGNNYGFTLSGGVFTTLQVSTAINDTVASGINSSGQVVGYYESADNIAHGFEYSNGNYTTINVPGAVNGTTQALGINDVGKIVGEYVAGANSSAFLLSGGIYSAILLPGSISSVATGINNAGQIVGNYLSTDQNSYGFVYSNGVFTSISYPDATGTTYVTGINNLGQIVGYYQDGQNFDGFVATPVAVPEPSTLLISAVVSLLGVTFAIMQRTGVSPLSDTDTSRMRWPPTFGRGMKRGHS